MAHYLDKEKQIRFNGSPSIPVSTPMRKASIAGSPDFPV